MSNTALRNSVGFFIIALLLLIVSASIAIPLGEGRVPISAQSLAVLLIGYCLGRWQGAGVVLVYLALGAMNLPVFAEGKAGIEVFQKGSGGFLYGFVLGAYLVGYLGKDLGWRTSFPKSLLAMTLGTAVIVLCGLLQLTYLYDWSSALKYGFYPFVPGAVVKIIIGAMVLPLYYRWFGISD